jgi:phosphotransferase system HPr (HPr) family protein
MREDPTHVEIEVTISNAQGLHARPVLRFVDLASQFESTVRIRKGKKVVDGKSPMEMMLLEAPHGTKLRLVADGRDAQAAIQALCGLIDSKFGED